MIELQSGFVNLDMQPNSNFEYLLYPHDGGDCFQFSPYPDWGNGEGMINLFSYP